MKINVWSVSLQNPHIYVIIIGSEILNGRRKDKHMPFVTESLKTKGYVPFCIEIIKDDSALIESSFRRVQSDAHAMLFCFGGIGSTPDDLTRAIAAKVFTDKPLVRHKQFENDIIERFREAAFPNRIEMSDLPKNAALLHNPVNNMSGFYLEKRYFFVPGFPEMAHPMVEEAIRRFLPENSTLHRQSFIAKCSEERFIKLMKTIPDDVECSSLPMFVDEKANVEISVASYNKDHTNDNFKRFLEYMDSEQIPYEVRDR